MKKLFILSLFIVSIASCNMTKTNYISFVGFTQGTTYNISYSSIDSIDYQEDIEILLANFDTSLSTYNKHSNITAINFNQSNKVDKYLYDVLLKAKEVYNNTEGALDLTLGPVINAWGFGFKQKENVTNHKIDSLLEFVGFEKISFTETTIKKSDERIMISVNAIAQGYSVDVVADFLESKGVENYLVEIGGEVKTKGVNKKGKTWKIGIDKPIDNNNMPGENLQAIIKLSNKSLATSGNYRKFYERDGIKYSHTINPKTGYPVSHSLLSTTVIANDCMTADAYATAFMVLGLEKSLEIIKTIPDLDAYFVYSDEEGNYKTESTELIKELLTQLN